MKQAHDMACAVIMGIGLLLYYSGKRLDQTHVLVVVLILNLQLGI